MDSSVFLPEYNLVLRRIFEGGLDTAGVGGLVFSDADVSRDLVSDPKVMLLVRVELVKSDKMDLGRLLGCIGKEAGVDAIVPGSFLTSGSSLTGVLMVKSTMLGKETSPAEFC